MSKHRTVMFALVLLAFAMTLAPSTVILRAQNAATPTPRPSPPNGDLYIALGDSLAAGIGASVPSRDGYVALLHDLMANSDDSPISLMNLSVPGATSDEVTSNQLPTAVDVITSAQSENRPVRAITISVGANDVLRVGSHPERRETALETVGAELDVTLTALRDALALSNDGDDDLTPILVVGYYDLTGTDSTQINSDAWWTDQLNTTLATTAADGNAMFVDVRPAFSASDEDLHWWPADIHPTNAGHAVIAREVWRVLGWDTTVPTVSWLRPSAGPIDRSVPTILVEVFDDVGVVTVTLFQDGQHIGTLEPITEIGPNMYGFAWDTRDLSSGTYELVVEAEDLAGNVGRASRELSVHIG